MPREPIILCSLASETRQMIEDYAEALTKKAPYIGNHGLSEEEFWETGIFRSAIEKLRGTQAAYMEQKRNFVRDILDYMQSKQAITSWKYSGAGERHDYEIQMPSNRLCVIETKGCLDGNNTNIFERPANADEFVVWSLCQNPGSDPAHNAWSGIHTRLSAEIIHRRQLVDGVIIWDMVCNTRGRPCPKVKDQPESIVVINKRKLPPPCLYLLPRTIPDPRNNPNPAVHTLSEISFLETLHRVFNGNDRDVVEVQIETRMVGPNIERRTKYCRGGMQFSESAWAKLKRAR